MVYHIPNLQSKPLLGNGQICFYSPIKAYIFSLIFMAYLSKYLHKCYNGHINVILFFI